LVNRGFERAAKREYESAEYQQGQARGWLENSGDTAPPRLLRFSSRARPNQDPVVHTWSYKLEKAA